MSEDLLKAATRALRDETAEPDADGEFTRARVMASLHQGRVRRRTRLAFILPIAACLAAGTAWATATGRLPQAFRALREVVYSTANPPAAKPPAPVAVKALPVPSVVEAPPPPPEASPAPAPVDVEPPAAVKPAPSTSSSAAFRDADGDLYRLAHEAHFARHDYARALSAWDAYLKAAPGGRLATEARYNRAICLLRLGRDAEARQALEPFAAGKLGYRQSEAQQLLDELSR
jgi:tetratricopeptide (TPR) repeat protein